MSFIFSSYYAYNIFIILTFFSIIMSFIFFHISFIFLHNYSIHISFVVLHISYFLHISSYSWDLEKFQAPSSFKYSLLAKHRAKRDARSLPFDTSKNPHSQFFWELTIRIPTDFFLIFHKNTNFYNFVVERN